MPRIAVFLPTWNSSEYIVESVNSILTQTYTDFTLHVVDDCSTDETSSKLSVIEDKRFYYSKQERNTGYVSILNTLIGSTDSEYIARMDSDDISHPLRFEKQISFLMKSNDIAGVGCWVRIINSNGNRISKIEYPINPSDISRKLLLGENPICHPSLMICRSTLGRNTYESNFMPSEDYALYLRLSSEGQKFSNIPSYLLDYRVHSKSISQRKRHDQFRNTVVALRKYTCLANEQVKKIYVPILWENYIKTDTFENILRERFCLEPRDYVYIEKLLQTDIVDICIKFHLVHLPVSLYLKKMRFVLSLRLILFKLCLLLKSSEMRELCLRRNGQNSANWG